MPVAVVDLFEFIQIHEKQGTPAGFFCIFQTVESLLRPAFHGCLVQQSRQRIQPRQLLQFGIDLHNLLLLLQHDRGVVGVGQRDRQSHHKGDSQVKPVAFLQNS